MAERPGTDAGPSLKSFDELVTYLSSDTLKLPKRLKQVASFVLSNPEDTAIYNIVELSRMAEVPSSTFTRFSRELGFSGFTDLQSVFRQRLLGPRGQNSDRKQQTSLSRRPRELEKHLDLDDPGAVLDAFVIAGVDTLRRMQDEVDRSSMTAFVDILANAPTVHIVSARGSFGVGAYCFYGFTQISKHANLVDNLGTMRAEQLRFARPGDAILAITFDDYTPETIEISERMAKAGHHVLCITDNELSPVARFAKHSLYVREGHLGHYRLQLPVMALCQSLIISVGRRMSRSN